MANKPLKSIKFPGLNDTYTVPEVDATLATTGAAADAKKVGDEINDLKADLNNNNSQSNRLFIGNSYSFLSVTATGSENILDINNTEHIGVGYKASIAVSENEVFKVSGRQFNSTISPAFILRSNGEIVWYKFIEDGYFTDYLVAIPSGVDELIVNLNSSAGLSGAIKKGKIITTDQLVDFIDKGLTSSKVGNYYAFDWIAGGWINTTNGQIVKSQTFSHSDYLPVAYTLKIRINGDFGGNSGPAFYDENKQYINYVYSGTYGLKEYIIDVPNGAKYVRLTCSNTSSVNSITKTLYYENYFNMLNRVHKETENNTRYIGKLHFNKLFTEMQKGVVNKNGGITETSDHHIIAYVNSGDILLVSGYQISDWFPLGIFRNDDTVVNSISIGKTGVADRYLITIPDGVNNVIINGTEGNKHAELFRGSGSNILQLKYGWETLAITPESGVIATDGSNVSAGNHMSVDVLSGEHYRISGKKWSEYVPGYVISNGTDVISYGSPDTEYFTDYEITIPQDGKILYINGNAVVGLKCKKYNGIDYQNKTKTMHQKSMVWFGTSIPQNSVYFDGDNWSIPTYVGKILRMNAINECYGASIAARGIYNQITENDPYGWTNVSWYAVFRSLGANLVEKQDLIDNYENKWYDLLGGSTDPLYVNAKPQALTDALKQEILSCSYENRLIPYLDGTKQMPDLFVFEHGYNDSQATIFSGISPDESNLNMSRYSDAMYFYFKKIFEANPQAKILVVSHYENTSATGKKTFEAQKELAEYHGIYFCDVANNVGWTQRLVTTTGYWQDGIWIPSGGQSRTITRLAQCIPDQVHPHTDKSGSAVKREAQIIADYILSNINLD